MTLEELTDLLFAQFGLVHNVRVKDGRKDRHGYRSKFSYAFVDFDCPSSSVDKALSERPIYMYGHVLNVNRMIAGGERRF